MRTTGPGCGGPAPTGARRYSGRPGRPGRSPGRPQAGIARPLEMLAARYPQYRADPPAGPVIRIRVERWTGWAAAGLPSP